ncbi:FMN-dependent NADH-azoreductase [Nereida sp. MMG025]|uniref:FMN-dependent NADH-azoreductase n=1 Tax=Nereida sp. MMG025 TaxID=2909981 RepID=UPI001F48F78A|nr:NAD(P)H-dependent oxidoreductase [Nereida sp. MMG025]MCF6444198.1 NAD(P)H-dependent oxidoreductase [Nereida sp. MMG025]
MTHSILRIDASANGADSVTRNLTQAIVEQLQGDVTHRDLAATAPQFATAGYISGRTLAPDERDTAQRADMVQPDALVAELEAADTIVIGLPIYNFGVPAALKAWADQVAIPGRTFAYSAEGPKGLLEGKRAIIAVASGGTKVGSEIDFATPWLRFFLGFIGVTDVQIIAADQLGQGAEDKISAAHDSIASIAA